MSPPPASPPPTRVPLVLLPGMDGTDILFGPLLRALPDWIEPICVEYPAAGRDDYDDLEPIVIEAVRQRPHCHVLGWSFSGPLALRAARAEPLRVRSVTLVATFVQRPLALLDMVGLLLVTPVLATVRTIRRLPIWLGRAPTDPLRRDKAKLWRRVRARTLAARARAIRTVDARADLQACRQPLLYVASANDRVVPRHNFEQIRRLRSDIELATIDGNHFSLYAQAAQGAAAIAAFVKRHEARGEANAGDGAPGHQRGSL